LLKDLNAIFYDNEINTIQKWKIMDFESRVPTAENGREWT